MPQKEIKKDFINNTRSCVSDTLSDVINWYLRLEICSFVVFIARASERKVEKVHLNE
jgi:hypothetical protein